jgi:hypothetical protein
VSYDTSGALAQLGERFAGSEEVRSSILLGSTNSLYILSNVLNGLSGIRLPLMLVVTAQLMQLQPDFVPRHALQDEQADTYRTTPLLHFGLIAAVDHR